MSKNRLQYVCKGCGQTFPCQRLPKSGYCRPCYRADPSGCLPDLSARLSVAVKTHLADPENREAHRVRTRQGRIDRIQRDPAFREQVRQQGKRVGALGLGHCREPAGSPARKAQGKTLTQTRLGDIPVEYRDDYRRIAKEHGAEYARHIIAEQVDVDAQRFARTGQLQQARAA